MIATAKGTMKMHTALKTGTVDRNSEDAQGRFIKGFAGGRERSVDLANRTVEGIASTINLDREREVILPSAFVKTLPGFIGSSAPYLAAHTHRTYDGKPSQIGWVLEAKITKTDVRCLFRYGTTDAAEQWWKIASDADGKGHAFSIGFIPRRWVSGSVLDLVSQLPELKKPLAAAGLKDDDKLLVFTEIELLEISAVPVPANREALQLLAAKWFAQGGEQPEELKQLRKELSEIVKSQLAEAGLDKAALENLKSEITQRVETAVAEIRDQVSQVLEAIALSSDSLDQANLPAKGAPAGGEEAGRADGGKGAVAKASNELFKTCKT